MLPKLSDKPEQGPGNYYIWSIPDRPVSIHLNLANVHALTASAGAGLGTLPRRGLEVGGLLLGRIVNPNPGQYIVSIEKTEPVEIEHVRGPSYILSSADREELFRHLRKYGKKSSKGPEVVGFYRSHTRPGLYLDEYDYDLMRSYFAHPSLVALLLRPVHDGPAKAGFFFWEDGEIHRASTYREFALDADQLNPHRSAERPDASAPMVSPLPELTSRPSRAVIPIGPPAIDVAVAAEPHVAQHQEPAASAVAESTEPAVAHTSAPKGISPTLPASEVDVYRGSADAHRAAVKGGDPKLPSAKAAVSAKPADAHRPAGKGTGPKSPTAEVAASAKRVVGYLAAIRWSAHLRGIREASTRQFANMGSKRYVAWTAAAAGLLLVAAALWQPFTRSSSERAHNVLALNIESTPSGLRLTWDRRNPVLRGQSSATLFITDGDLEKKIVLDGSQLRNGAILYGPTSQDVNFRLQVGDFTESLRALALKLPTRSEPEAPVNTAQSSQGTTVPVPNAAPQDSVAPQARSRQQEIRPAVLPAPGESAPARSQEFTPPPPVELPATPHGSMRPR